MATKIILTIPGGLTRQEMDDLRYMLADALGEFAVRREPARAYVEGRYPGADYYVNREEKVAQVQRRIHLATKLNTVVHTYELEHVLPHAPTPVLDYYKMCDEDDLPAMSALLEFLPASRFGERKGWLVRRDEGILLVEGPDEQRAFWNETAGRWAWLEEAPTREWSTL